MMIYDYQLSTYDENQHKYNHISYYIKDDLKNAIKEYNNQVSLYHGIDGQRVHICLTDINTLVNIEEYDSDFDNT